jgi:hypothetical protein
MVYEARSDNKLAAHYYRKVIDFVPARPDHYESRVVAIFQRLIQTLGPVLGRLTAGFPKKLTGHQMVLPTVRSQREVAVELS